MLSLLVVSAALASAPVAIDLEYAGFHKYAGLWFQMYGSGRFAAYGELVEGLGSCVTVNVTHRDSGEPDTGFKLNTAWAVLGHPFHTDEVAVQGEALWKGAPGEYYVHHWWSSPIPTTNYIVFGVGPVVDGKYDWAIVTDPEKTFVQILARKWSRFVGYQEEVLAIVEREGFNTKENLPRPTSQEDCDSWPRPPIGTTAAPPMVV